MSAVTIPGLKGQAPTNNVELLTWIAEAVELLQPDEVVFTDGSQEEADRLAEEVAGFVHDGGHRAEDSELGRRVVRGVEVVFII